MPYAIDGSKECFKCRRTLPVSEFYKNSSRGDGYDTMCKRCKREQQRKLRGYTSVEENESCPAHLGVFIAEPYLLEYFGKSKRMPSGNPGYDYICSKGFKIDVKASCRSHTQGCTVWTFRTLCNQIADYFFCIAYNNRESLYIEHVWLIPGAYGRDRQNIQITTGPKSLAKWEQFELEVKR